MDLEGVFFQLADCHGGKRAPRTLVGMFTWNKMVARDRKGKRRGKEGIRRGGQHRNMVNSL